MIEVSVADCRWLGECQVNVCRGAKLCAVDGGESAVFLAKVGREDGGEGGGDAAVVGEEGRGV